MDGLIVENKRTTVLSEKSVFYPTTLQRMRLKNASFLYGISSFHHDVFMSGEHNTFALSLQDESPGLVLRADVAAELRSLRRYYHLSMHGIEISRYPQYIS